MGISDLGLVCLAVVFFLCAFAAAAALIAFRLSAEAAKRVISLSRYVMLVSAGFVVAVLILLVTAFLTDNFSISVVSRYSSIELPRYYKLSAIWAGSAGSLLCWSVVVFIFFALWLLANDFKRLEVGYRRLSIHDMINFNAFALAIGSVVCMGFSGLLIFLEKPFMSTQAAVDNGMGLNPVLRNFWMVIHPPLLFVGYSAFFIPFIVVLACVFAGIRDASEIYRGLKKWLLLGICFLGLGVVTGARWSYLELGWGGPWVWDPVQNISLLPLLVGLAALHSVIGMRLTDKFRFWTIILAPLPFILCLFVTFIIRSGSLPSLHSFVEKGFSPALLAFIGYCFLLWLICVVRAAFGGAGPLQVTGFRLDKAEAVFWAVVVFILTAAVIGIVTFFPVVWKASAGSGSGITLSPSFYRYAVLLSGMLLAFFVCASALVDLQERRGFLLQLMACCGVSLLCFGLVYRFLEKELFICLVCSVCVFSFVAVLIKLVLNLNSIGQIAGGIAHLGLLLLLITVGISSDTNSIQVVLERGGRVGIGKYYLFYDSFRRSLLGGVTREGPEIIVRKKNFQKMLWPHDCLYPDGRRTAEVAVHTGLFEDVYVSFDRVNSLGNIVITAKINPFMSWAWLAAILVTAGLALGLLKAEKTIRRRRGP